MSISTAAMRSRLWQSLPRGAAPARAAAWRTLQPRPRPRPIHAQPARLAAAPGPGSHSRTERDIEVKQPPDRAMPSSAPATGQGGQFAKPTLASFSLEGKVGVVTGGARGLGLVMAQGMFVSGADIALVDLNGLFLGL